MKSQKSPHTLMFFQLQPNNTTWPVLNDDNRNRHQYQQQCMHEIIHQPGAAIHHRHVNQQLRLQLMDQ